MRNGHFLLLTIWNKFTMGLNFEGFAQECCYFCLIWQLLHFIVWTLGLKAATSLLQALHMVSGTHDTASMVWHSVFQTYCISFSCFDKSKIIDLLNIGVRASCHRLNTTETAQRYRCKFVLSCQLQHLNMFVPCTELDWVGWISYCYVWFLYHLSGFDHLEGWICYVHNFSLNCDLKRNYFMQEITYKLLYNHELVCLLYWFSYHMIKGQGQTTILSPLLSS